MRDLSEFLRFIGGISVIDDSTPKGIELATSRAKEYLELLSYPALIMEGDRAVWIKKGLGMEFPDVADPIRKRYRLNTEIYLELISEKIKEFED